MKGCTKSLDTLMKRVEEAIALCLAVKGEAPSSTEFIGIQRVPVKS